MVEDKDCETHIWWYATYAGTDDIANTWGDALAYEELVKQLLERGFVLDKDYSQTTAAQWSIRHPTGKVAKMDELPWLKPMAEI